MCTQDSFVFHCQVRHMHFLPWWSTECRDHLFEKLLQNWKNPSLLPQRGTEHKLNIINIKTPIYCFNLAKKIICLFNLFAKACLLLSLKVAILQDITPETDVHEFESKKTGRGRLSKDWAQTTKPVMCCYKVIASHAIIFKPLRTVET